MVMMIGFYNRGVMGNQIVRNDIIYDPYGGVHLEGLKYIKLKCSSLLKCINIVEMVHSA
jgi:hypothetical protein